MAPCAAWLPVMLTAPLVGVAAWRLGSHAAFVLARAGRPLLERIPSRKRVVGAPLTHRS